MMEMENEDRWNKAAVASFVIPIAFIALTLLFACIRYTFPVPELYEFVIAWPLAGLALSVFGIVSYRRGQQGIMLAVCGLILNGLILVIFVDPCICNPSHAVRASCASNIKQVSTAILTYSQDYDGHLPPWRKWNEAIYDATKSKAILICPEDKSGKVSYAMNRALFGLDITKIDNPGHIIMLYECTPGDNMVGGTDMAAFRHERGCNVGYADGHVKWLLEKDFRTQMDRKLILKSSASTHAQQSER